MAKLLEIIHRADEDYGHTLGAVYFYEWRDSLWHPKITYIPVELAPQSSHLVIWQESGTSTILRARYSLPEQYKLVPALLSPVPEPPYPINILQHREFCAGPKGAYFAFSNASATESLKIL